MAVKVLGPMDIGDQSLGPRERTILAALIVRRGMPVTPSELADAWWAGEPPATWAQQIRNSVARIRARLGHDSVETVSTDYRLGLDPDSIDAVRFERLASEARGHALRGEDDRAIDAYRRGLALWRGAPFQDVSDWEPGVVEALRLDEIRRSVQEELLDARLRQGEHRAVIPDAERLVREDPLREDRWAILALANYRADRQAEALATVRAARERLADELGIEPGARLTALETAMLRRDASLDAPVPMDAPSAECPYPGLRSFGVDEADLFFGRSGDIDAVLERLRPGTAVVVAGASGTGKSSLALAGVVPRLAATGRVAEVVRPTLDLAHALRQAGSRAQVIVLDQAEEFTGLDAAAIDEACTAADALLHDGRALLFTARSDSLDRLRALPRIGDALGRGVYLLGPLSIEGCRDAVEQPARLAGLRLEPGLVEVALRDAGDRAATLPHLSHALRQTWLRREGATLTVAGYEESGGIAGAIAQSAEEVFRGLDEQEQATCRAIMRRLVVRAGDGTSTRRRIDVATLLEDPERRTVVERLAAARLLSVDRDTVTIAHEAVATAWPRLDGWLTEDQERARVVRMVESAAQGWEDDGRNDDDLLRGARLHLALAWREASTHDLTTREREFLDASSAQESSRIRELETRAATERSRNRALRAALGGAAALLVAAIVAGTVAGVRGVEAQSSSEDARIEALVASSIALESSDRDLAALLAVEGYRRWPADPRVRSALLATMIGADGLVRRDDFADSMVAYGVIPRTGEAVRVTDRDGGAAVEVVDLDSGEVVRTVDAALPAATTPYSRTVVVSPDGDLAAVQTPGWTDPAAEDCCVNAIAFIELDSGRVLPSSQVLTARTTASLVFSSDSTRLLFGNSVTSDIQAVDIATGEFSASSPSAFEDHAGEIGVSDATALVEPGAVAVGARDAIIVYDEVTLAVRQRIATPAPDMASMSLVADGAGGLVGTGEGGMVRVDATTGAVVWSQPPVPGRPCLQLAVRAEAGALYCSPLGSVREFDLATGRPTGRELSTFVDEPVLITPRTDRDALLLQTTIAAVAFTWMMDGSGLASRVAAPDRMLVGGLGDGDTVAVTVDASGDSLARLWDLGADAPVGEPAEHLVWLSDSVYERWTEDEGSTLVGLDGTEARLADEILDRVGADAFAAPARPGPLPFAFADGSDTFVALDPATGNPVGPFITIPDAPEGILLNGLSSAASGDRVAVTYYDNAQNATMTAVFDTTDGTMIARGLGDTEGNVITHGGELIAATDESLTRFDLDTLAPEASFPKAFSSANTIEISDDDRTMLVVGWDNRATLYALPAGVKLGTFDAPSIELSGGAHLARDGMSMVTSSPDGILVWDLDPAHHAEAACDITGREMTVVEWQTYFGDEKQRPTCDAG